MKAQFWSFDVIFSMVVFGSALLLLTFIWLSVSNQYSVSYGLGSQTMQAQAQSLQARLLTSGFPPNWNALVNVTNTTSYSNISIGIGTGVGPRLSQNKMMTLMAMSSYNSITYQSTKPLLGVGYDYYIIINSSNSTMAMGISPYTHSPFAIQTARANAYLNGRLAKIQIIIWTNKTFGVS